VSIQIVSIFQRGSVLKFCNSDLFLQKSQNAFLHLITLQLEIRNIPPNILLPSTGTL